MQNIKIVTSNIINFLRADIWRITLNNLPWKKSFFIKQLRIILLAIRGFGEDKCVLQASALTFYSLLSIVPVAAMALGIARGFGFEKVLQKQLLDKFPGQEEVVAQIITFAHSLLENTKGGMIAGIGVLILFLIVIRVLGQIEASFNDIWEIKESRTLGRKFSDYLSIMLICPFFVIISGSITVFITTQVRLITEKIALLGMFSFFIFFIIKFLPYILIWTLFTIIYILMPHTRVNVRSGLPGGIIAGTIYQLVQKGYIYFQVKIAQHNAIYGSFAALPLFLIWLQLSWLIVLLGAEISFAHQNVDTYEFEPDCPLISPFFKKLLSLQIAHLLIKNFAQGKKALTADQISHTLQIPVRLVRQILYELVESGNFSDTSADEYRDVAYQPARDINVLTVNYILNSLEHRGVDNIPVARTEELMALTKTLQSFKDLIEKSPANKLLKDI